MDELRERPDALLDILEVVGTVAFAVSGALAARRARMDWFGVVVLGVIVAIGGGTLRDVLLGRPVLWINDGWPVPLAAATALVTLVPRVHGTVAYRSVRRMVLAADAVGLAAFAVAGADLALASGIDWWVSAVLGVVTAVFGGIFRDVLINERPAVLTGEIYALAAATAATLYVALAEAGVNRWVAIWLPVAVALAMRGLVLWRGWSAPTVGTQRDERPD